MTAAKSPEVLISAGEIAERVAAMAETIAAAMPPDMMIVSLLRGSFVFTADLIRALYFCSAKNQLPMRPQMDFMTMASYGALTTSSGQIKIVRDLTESVSGRDVLIVDDILESGRTLSFARELLAQRGAGSTRIAVLLEKPGKRAIQIDADFVGFVIPDHFVVGYGLDFANYYRELPYIGVIEAD